MYKIDQNAIVWRMAGDEVVILNLATGHYYTLNDVGLIIWEGVLQNQTIDVLAQNIVEAFEIDPKTAIKDADECIKQLMAEGLVSHGS